MQSTQQRTALEHVLTQSNLTHQLLSLFNIVHEKNTFITTNKSLESSRLPWSQYLLNKTHFYCFKEKSTVVNAGYGVFLRSKPKSFIKQGQIVSLYPGTVYMAHEPKFFQSIGNSFILQRKDFTFIDGNDRFISKFMYKSCANRDAILVPIDAKDIQEKSSLGNSSRKRYREMKRVQVCDTSWLKFRDHTCERDIDEKPVLNPFNIGHYINSPLNNGAQDEANVMYYEYDFCVGYKYHNNNCGNREDNARFIWPLDLQYLIPNIHYQQEVSQPYDLREGEEDYPLFVKSIVLVALRDIEDGEELFASYENLIVVND